MPQSIVEPLRRWDPERIGPYTIIGRLGAGAMGQVFLARSTAGRLVAVKTIRIELAEEADFRARFAREVAAASRVSGVFTAAVIEADPDADLPWVATAYVPAPSLSTLVQAAGPLPVPAVRWLAAGCAEALQSIHGAGLLHRDVKPSNVLVAPDGPRVIDFGVARAAERVALTTTRAGSGTPAYMAPEQARDASRASPASDVFSLGATLVYAATGHPPYQGETVMDILVRLATEPPDLTGLPEELYGLIAACLERVPRDRPSDTAILARLGSFALLAGPGHDYLPDDAMAVIGEYQRGPLLPGRPRPRRPGRGRRHRRRAVGRRRDCRVWRPGRERCHGAVAHRPARLSVARQPRRTAGPGIRPGAAPAFRTAAERHRVQAIATGAPSVAGGGSRVAAAARCRRGTRHLAARDRRTGGQPAGTGAHAAGGVPPAGDDQQAATVRQPAVG